MGVLTCDRNGCDNVMSENYSETYGYLCKSCLDELLGVCGIMSISDFMGSVKDEEFDNMMQKTVLKTFKNKFEED